MDQSESHIPAWVTLAEEGMAACGVEPEVLLTRALLLGAKIDGPLHGISNYANWSIRPHPHRPGMFALYGKTAEMAAYRWLVVCYPETFKKPHVV